MGYESILFVVHKTNISSRDDGKVWAEIIAAFNLCKVYDVSDIIRRKYPATDAYVIIGEDDVYEDMYGETMREIPLKDMIAILKKAMEKDDYRRYKPCLAMLEGFVEAELNSLVVLHYGY